MAIPKYPRKIAWVKEGRFGGNQTQTSMWFTLLSNKGEQVAPFTCCRDYLHDMVFAQVNRWDHCVYPGYRAGAPSISLKQARILVADSKTDGLYGRAERALEFIQKVEWFIGIKSPARAYWIEEGSPAFQKKPICLFVGSAPWMLAPPMLSLFTLSIRVGFGADPNKSPMEMFESISEGEPAYIWGDRMICQWAKHSLRRLRNEGYKNIFYTDPRANYPSSAKDGTQSHGSFGIASFAKGAPRHYIPFWYPPDWKCPSMSMLV